jgi:hypothetical protein
VLGITAQFYQVYGIGVGFTNAGLGTDSILINASNITALEQTGTGNRARVNGGGGVDTLKLDGADLTLDLTSISNTRIQDIEIIDIKCVGVFITEIINGVLGISLQCRRCQRRWLR